MSMKLLLVRHAESIGNQQGRMEGQGGSGLSAVGRRQARQLGQTLLSAAWWPSQVYSSPLRRAAETTEILLSRFLTGQTPIRRDIPVIYDAALQELGNGIFQDLTWSEACQQYPALCTALEASPEWLPIPGGESLQQGRDRAYRFMQTLLHHHGKGDCLWIVTHGGILQHLVAALLGCDRTWGFSAGHTARFEFWLDDARWEQTDHNRFNTELWQIRHFNDQSHLTINS